MTSIRPGPRRQRQGIHGGADFDEIPFEPFDAIPQSTTSIDRALLSLERRQACQKGLSRKQCSRDRWSVIRMRLAVGSAIWLSTESSTSRRVEPREPSRIPEAGGFISGFC